MKFIQTTMFPDLVDEVLAFDSDPKAVAKPVKHVAHATVCLCPSCRKRATS